MNYDKYLLRLARRSDFDYSPDLFIFESDGIYLLMRIDFMPVLYEMSEWQLTKGMV